MTSLSLKYQKSPLSRAIKGFLIGAIIWSILAFSFSAIMKSVMKYDESCMTKRVQLAIQNQESWSSENCVHPLIYSFLYSVTLGPGYFFTFIFTYSGHLLAQTILAQIISGFIFGLVGMGAFGLLKKAIHGGMILTVILLLTFTLEGLFMYALWQAG